MFEVIATNINDVMNISRSCATNIELCVDIKQDGLTPPISLVYQALNVSRKKIRVMVRPEDSFYTNEAQVKAMIRYIKQVKKIANDNLEGFVFGYLLDDKLDQDNMNKLILAAKPYKVTLHKACDLIVIEPEYFSSLGIDTILTQGGQAKILDNLELLNELNASPLNILVGGGVNDDNLPMLKGFSIHIGSLARFDKSYDRPINIDKINEIHNSNF